MRDGDLPGWGTNIGSRLSMSKDECAQACNEKTSCLSFEHSESMMLCNLNELAEPTLGAFRDFAFCKKGGLS